MVATLPPSNIHILKYMYFFSVALAIYFQCLINGLALISWADIHQSGLFHPEIVLYFLNCPICTTKYRFVSILETLAAYPWSCTFCTSHRWMIDSPSLQPHRCWLVSWDTCMCWRSPLIWLTAQQNNGRYDTFEDPCLHPDRNWGFTFLHSFITEDLPFCTCYKQKDLKSCNVIGYC